MLERLQKKWKVSGIQLVLIIATFAIGGSLTGYVARKLMPVFGIDQTGLWIVVYILLVTLLWPLAVILISIPFGQFRFFTKYLKKIGRRMGIVRSQKSDDRSSKTELLHSNSRNNPQEPANITIFASGAGSNAQKIIEYFRYSKKVRVNLVVCNKPGAGVIRIAEENNIPVLLIEKERFFRGDAYVPEMQHTDLIILAGFLWKLPSKLVAAFHDRIINIHPALLPKFGGKGMYGHAVHAAVIDNKEKESGISIHYVDDEYDHGRIIFKATCPVLENDTAESLAKRIQLLEHEFYPKIIEKLLVG